MQISQRHLYLFEKHLHSDISQQPTFYFFCVWCTYWSFSQTSSRPLCLSTSSEVSRQVQTHPVNTAKRIVSKIWTKLPNRNALIYFPALPCAFFPLYFVFIGCSENERFDHSFFIVFNKAFCCWACFFYGPKTIAVNQAAETKTDCWLVPFECNCVGDILFLVSFSSFSSISVLASSKMGMFVRSSVCVASQVRKMMAFWREWTFWNCFFFGLFCLLYWKVPPNNGIEGLLSEIVGNCRNLSMWLIMFVPYPNIYLKPCKNLPSPPHPPMYSPTTTLVGEEYWGPSETNICGPWTEGFWLFNQSK